MSVNKENNNNKAEEIPINETSSKENQTFSEKLMEGLEKTGNKFREIGSNVKVTLSKDFQIVSKKVTEGLEKTGDKIREVGSNVKSRIDERRLAMNSANKPKDQAL